jgi:ubiquinone/menaquinone biosynthesis C-methylase UbiE
MYFTALAPNYSYLTGNTTRDLLLDFLTGPKNQILFDTASKVHDNASGPGTATEAIMIWSQSQDTNGSPSVVATDYVPAMIEALNVIKSKNDTWANVTAEVQDSHSLTYANDAFSHTICNFSVFTFTDPLTVLKEIHRTLKPKATAVITTWKRFAIGNIMRAAQKAVQGTAVDALQMPGEEFASEDYLANMVVQAGWEQNNIRTEKQTIVVKEGNDLDGLMAFMIGPFTAMARSKFTDEENIKWPEAITDAVETEKKAHGGLLMEAWFVIATK